MKSDLDGFVSRLSTLSAGMQQVYSDCVTDWLPDEPPRTVLFGALGRQFAEEFSTLSDLRRNEACSLVEAAMLSKDERLVTAVATGFIEAMVGRAYGIQGQWNLMWPMLGEASRRHATAWLST
jgi:hypothetical protein